MDVSWKLTASNIFRGTELANIQYARMGLYLKLGATKIDGNFQELCAVMDYQVAVFNLGGFNFWSRVNKIILWMLYLLFWKHILSLLGRSGLGMNEERRLQHFFLFGVKQKIAHNVCLAIYTFIFDNFLNDRIFAYSNK